MAEKSAVDRIKELDQERGKLLSDAKEDALTRAHAAIAVLRSLGFNYSLTEGAAATRKSRKGTRKLKDADCPVCKFKTDPPHDARRHRSQGKSKKAFTPAELKAMGLKKV